MSDSRSPRHIASAFRKAGRGVRGAFLLIALAALAAAPTGAAAQTTPAPAAIDAPPADSVFGEPAVGVLRPGDELNVVIFRNKELSGKYLIDSRGYVQIPGLGVLRVAGLDPHQVSEVLRMQLIRRGIADPEIAVQPLVRVSVLGEVRSPGLYPVEPGTSLLQMLTVAGGPTDRADLSEAVIVREGRQIRVDVAAALRGGELGRFVLYSNDVIVMPQKSDFFSRENLGMAANLAGLVLSIMNLYLLATR